MRARSRRGASGSGGFSLLEVQIAILVLVLAVMGLMATVANQNRHLVGVEEYGRVRGVTSTASKRVVVAFTEAATTGPACDIRLDELDERGHVSLTARVRVFRP